MNNINITNFRKNAYNYIENTIKFGDALSISTKNGNAVLLSEEEYRGLMETLYLMSVPGLAKDLKAGMEEKPEDMADVDESEW